MIAKESNTFFKANEITRESRERSYNRKCLSRFGNTPRGKSQGASSGKALSRHTLLKKTGLSSRNRDKILKFCQISVLANVPALVFFKQT